MRPISFVIPAHQEEKLIAGCIKSIQSLNSLPEEYEIIVIANACTDRTALTSFELGAYVYHQPIKGVTHARHLGYQMSSYPFIAFIDADNVLPPDWLVHAFPPMVERPWVAAISGPLVFRNMPFVFQPFHRFYNWITAVFHQKFSPMIQGGNFIIRKSFLDDIGGYPHSEFYGEDTKLAQKLSKVGGILLNTDMWCYASDRRLRQQGIFSTAWYYTVNYLWVAIRGKEFSHTHTDWR